MSYRLQLHNLPELPIFLPVYWVRDLRRPLQPLLPLVPPLGRRETPTW